MHRPMNTKKEYLSPLARRIDLMPEAALLQQSGYPVDPDDGTYDNWSNRRTASESIWE